MTRGEGKLFVDSARGRTRVVVAIIFLFAAGLHFTATDTEVRLMPRWLPLQRELVYASGIAEIIGAVGLLVPRTYRAAGWWLALLLLAVFPANINHTITQVQMGGFMDTRLYHWLRLPLQPVFIAVVLWATAKERVVDGRQ